MDTVNYGRYVVDDKPIKRRKEAQNPGHQRYLICSFCVLCLFLPIFFLPTYLSINLITPFSASFPLLLNLLPPFASPLLLRLYQHLLSDVSFDTSQQPVSSSVIVAPNHPIIDIIRDNTWSVMPFDLSTFPSYLSTYRTIPQQADPPSSCSVAPLPVSQLPQPT